MDKVKEEKIVARPPLDKDDPRVARYQEEYEQRMAAQGDGEAYSEEQRAEAKATFAKATAAHEAAVEAHNKATADLAAARAEFARQADLYARFSAPAAVSPAETLSPGEETVLMVFPNPVTLQASVKRPDGTMTGTQSATFPEGIQEVPVSLQNHTYLIAHNVHPYGGSRIAPKAHKETKAEKKDKAKE